MKGHSAPNKDGISINLVKQIKESISQILAHNIFNTIIWGKVPHQIFFKSAIVIQIYKNGDKKLINYYRAISLLNICSKMFKRAIKKKSFKLHRKKIILYLNLNMDLGKI